ncbi:TPA: hypothetical protein N0F65_004473 [Lagenidium giganteum]|uniref:Uncharacterized protein n=1 Tax=Lagenidium giganteum TaxID=4803 RepID=A0AAV2ZFC1_9STRA|nr:TPA: hypothetical protein N0F65_004473 [Lagenidium giganteum]
MERVEATRGALNVKHHTFQAGISSKFTKRHVANFEDTTIMAASAAKQRAERKLERQADAIDKQQKKIEHEIKKIETITQRLHLQQQREAKRLRNRLNYAASRIQTVFRLHQQRVHCYRQVATVEIQRRWRGLLGRRVFQKFFEQRQHAIMQLAAEVITSCVRRQAARCRRARHSAARQLAALVIQRATRCFIARRILYKCLCHRALIERQYQAATVIQAHARGMMTRLVYLDVLYLICRIQASIRGFLVRQRLRWCLHMNGICKFQALYRGHRTRQQLPALLPPLQSPVDDLWVQPGARTRDQSQSLVQQQPITRRTRPRSGHPLQPLHEQHTTKRKATKAAASPAPSPAPVKRNYWLPSGANIANRLPALSRNPAVTMVTIEATAYDMFDDDALNTHASRAPKRRHQKSRPPRLLPVGAETTNASAKLVAMTTPEFRQAQMTLEDKQRREEELKLKLIVRKFQEKKRVEQELRMKRDLELETIERKLLEKEEKLMRLHAKLHHRRQSEIKAKKHTLDNEREERERFIMAREERLMRLHIKALVRAAATEKKNKHMAECQASDNTKHVLSHGGGSGDALKRSEKRKREVRGESERGQPASDEDDLSFLDIDFKIPASMRSHGLRKSHAPAKPSKHKATSKPQPARVRPPHNQEESHEYVAVPPEIAELQPELDYGFEFDDFVEETELRRLIC